MVSSCANAKTNSFLSTRVPSINPTLFSIDMASLVRGGVKHSGAFRRLWYTFEIQCTLYRRGTIQRAILTTRVSQGYQNQAPLHSSVAPRTVAYEFSTTFSNRNLVPPSLRIDAYDRHLAPPPIHQPLFDPGRVGQGRFSPGGFFVDPGSCASVVDQEDDKGRRLPSTSEERLDKVGSASWFTTFGKRQLDADVR